MKYSFSYLWAKLIKKVRGAAIHNSVLDKTVVIESGSHIVNSNLGKYSYCGYDCQIINSKIGAFCSLGNNIMIGGAKHPADWVSTSPVFYKGRDSIKTKFATFERNEDKQTIIGNDVWIGNNVIILQGVKIEDGAIIGTGAIVTKDVPAYAIVVGNPAHIIKMRFDEEMIEDLLKTKWWGLEDNKLKVVAQYIKSPVDFINHIKEVK